MMRMVGAFACQGQWSSALDRACYRATQQLHVNLNSDEMDVIGELYSRITWSRNEEEINSVLATWFDLQSYREDYLRKIRQSQHEGYVLSKEEVERVHGEYVWYVLWYEQNEKQKRRSSHSRMCAFLHKKAGRSHAAKAVIKYGLPKILPSTDDATERINAVGTFAQHLAKWLQSFAQGLNEYRNTAEYARALLQSRRRE